MSGLVAGSVVGGFPRVRFLRGHHAHPVAGRDVAAHGMAAEPVYAAFALLEVDRVGWQVPVHCCVAPPVEIDALLADTRRSRRGLRRSPKCSPRPSRAPRRLLRPAVATDCHRSGRLSASSHWRVRSEVSSKGSPGSGRSPVPVVGYETDAGIPIDFAWPDVHLAVRLDVHPVVSVLLARSRRWVADHQSPIISRQLN